MRLGSRRLAEVRLGWPGKTAGAALPTVYGDGQPYYRIEVRDASGDLLATVPRWIAADTEERINEPITLSLSIWYGDFAAQYLVNPNQVWLYRGDGATPEHKCIIYRTRDESTEGEVRTVQAHGLLRKLADETVTEYDTGEDGKPVRAIVADLLGFQTLAPTIRAGFIASAYGNEVRVLRVEYKTVWQALDELRTTLGGVFTLTPENRLDWRVSSGVNIGHVIRIGRNATSVTREMDYESVFTRVVGLGAGVSDDTRLKVTVNDAAAQALYGVRVGYLNDQSITDEDALTAAATAALNRWKVPRTTYSVGVIDLSRADLYSINFEAFGVTLGTRVNLIAAGIGLDIDTRIASVRRDLADPLGVSVTVTDPNAGDGVQGPDDGGNDPERAEPDDLESWAESVERRLQRTEGDTGVLASVAQAIGVGDTPSALGNVAWWDPDVPDGNLPELLEDVLGSDDPDALDYQDALSDFITGQVGGVVPTPGGSTQAIATTGAAGSSGNFSRADHVHVGLPWITATNAAGLASGGNPAGVLGWASTDLQWYIHAGSDSWLRHLVTCEIVNTLPAVPSVGSRRVFWRSTSGGTGDDQIWEAHAGQSRWYPSQKPTNKSGTP
jgi:hypothetical protein